jgi:hypothetical protein
VPGSGLARHRDYQSGFQPGSGLREPWAFGSGNGMLLMGSECLSRTTSFGRPTCLTRSRRATLGRAGFSTECCVRPRSRTTTAGRGACCREGGVRPRLRTTASECTAGCAPVSVFTSHIRRLGRYISQGIHGDCASAAGASTRIPTAAARTAVPPVSHARCANLLLSSCECPNLTLCHLGALVAILFAAQGEAEWR